MGISVADRIGLRSSSMAWAGGQWVNLKMLNVSHLQRVALVGANPPDITRRR